MTLIADVPALMTMSFPQPRGHFLMRSSSVTSSSRALEEPARISTIPELLPEPFVAIGDLLRFLSGFAALLLAAGVFAAPRACCSAS